MNPVIGILADIVHLLRLVVFALLDMLGTVIRPVLVGLGFIGFATCALYALVAPQSRFPQAEMLAVSGGCLGLVVLYDVIAYAIKPK